MTYDVIVVGLGGMGSAAFFEASRRGARVLGLDMHGVAHDKGSSHGETRLIRQAYFEHPDYVPLLKRSYEHWHDRNQDTDTHVFHQTGLIIAAKTTDSGLLQNVLISASKHKIPVEILDHKQQCEKYPHLDLTEDSVSVYEPGAGYLDVERAIKLHIDLAVEKGGVWRQENVCHWESHGSRVHVKTDRGNHYAADQLILCPGPWAPHLIDCKLLLRVRRVPLFWFRPKNSQFQASPCFAFDFGEGFFYGFPEQNGLVKVAPHIPGDITDADHVDRSLHQADKQLIERIVQRYLPSLNPEVANHKVCMYTMSKDEHFYIDRHPDAENVVLAVGMSGHGFKFAPVIGEVLADLALDGKTALPCEFLKIGRH